ncbi:MAG: hypothetical protein JXR83_06995 [Deltaproteobacteria bacterium]|nr:hypothetical protein [Deltaproteobacteria bacterium]
MRIRSPLALLAIVLGCGLGCAMCEDDDLGRLRPKLEFDPPALAYGPRAIGVGHLLTTRALSRGSADLQIVGVRLDPPDQPFVVNAYPDFLKVGATGEVVVTFSPGARGQYSADAVFTINVDTDNEVRLPLTGEVGPPRIEVLPPGLDFGRVNQDVGRTLPLRITNVGGDWLDVTGLSFASSTDEFSALDATSTIDHDLAPGDYWTQLVKYAPLDLGADQNTLRIVSNAENGPTTDVPLTALANLSPVAFAFEINSHLSELSVDPDVELTLSSEGTYDPEGEQPLSLYWQIIEKPPGANVVLPANERDTPQTHIAPKLVGDYRVRLLATDPGGAQGHADVVIHAIRDLVVRLRWETAAGALCTTQSAEHCEELQRTDIAEWQRICCGQTDLDLHLVRPDGDVGDYYGTCPDRACSACAPQATCGCPTGQGDCSAFVNYCGCLVEGDARCAACRSDGDDCAYPNRRPDWGLASDPLDDPRLDVDDVRGQGPEIISLNGPVDGNYKVYVHFCNDRIGEPSDATVEVFVKGVLRWTAGPQRLDVSLHQDLWLAAILTKTGENWNATLPQAVTQAPDGLCTMQ